ncbi:hypothetical protein GCK32_016349 [Trichostrongylus colubriformis]|uniref:Uncharacterized protein n=1 Tax=Trichostrongylus colubriformis TaxID=6319 RepID=A0AAN8FAZ4_TRICO
MTSASAARQGLLTRASNRLSAISDEDAVLFATQEDSNETKDIKELHRRIRTTKATLIMEVEKVGVALIKYSSAVDELPVGTPSKEEILKRAKANIDAAQEALDRAHVALTKLLQQNTRNKEVAREIDSNTYVDNVVITARSTVEATTFYKESKKVFRDMRMNLRIHLERCKRHATDSSEGFERQ